MTNVSKRKLPQKEFDALYSQLHGLTAQLDKTSSKAFFDDLLGTEEKIMLVKRLAAVVMYIEDNSSYRVWQLLNMSPSTAEKIRLDFESGRYNRITKLITKNKSGYVNFWKTLETILQAGMPPQGRGRWKSILNP